jgi:hypothetical protein
MHSSFTMWRTFHASKLKATARQILSRYEHSSMAARFRHFKTDWTTELNSFYSREVFSRIETAIKSSLLQFTAVTAGATAGATTGATTTTTAAATTRAAKAATWATKTATTAKAAG